ncbi:MAG: phosphonate ABC transporter, permease protein PhnE [Opitutales bacterium]
MNKTPKKVPSEQWQIKPVWTPKLIGFLLVAAILFALSARHTEVDRMVGMSAEAVAVTVGLKDDSQVYSGMKRILTDLFPMKIEERREVNRIENFDRDNLPWFSRIETETSTQFVMNSETLSLEEVESTREVLVQPVGYLLYACKLMIQTIEIAFWGTVLAILLAIPLGFGGARNYAKWGFFYHASRSICSFMRAMPELIIALFLVLAYGFGPIAGVLALGLHTAGFLGKFFAEDIENADRGPQEAVSSTGANRIQVFLYTVFPQVAPSYAAYVQYILERNIRSATVLGVVGAGGIGQELKGQFEMFNYSHVATILFIILLTVMVLEHLTGMLRKRIL